MGSPWELDPPVAAKPWELDPPVGAPELKKVGAGEAGTRGLKQGFGAVNQWAGNMAMLPIIGVESLANLFRDKPDFAMSDWGMRKFVTPFESMQQTNAIKQGEELTPMGVAANVAGNLAGQAPALAMPMAPANQAPRMVQQALPMIEQIGNIIAREAVQAQPLAQSAMVQRSNQLQAQGVPADVAQNAALAGYGVDALGYAVPISATGNVLKRIATGAPANIAASLPATARENYVLQASGHGDQVTDPFSMENLTTEGITGSVLAALLGQRAPRYQTAEQVQAMRDLDAAKANQVVQDAIMPDSGLSVADIINHATGAGTPAPAKEAVSARRKDAAQAFGKTPEDPVIYRRDSMDPATGEMQPSVEAGTGTIATDPNRLAGQQQARQAESLGSRQVDPGVAAAYGEAGENPNSVASAFERARQFGTPDPNAEPDVRSVKAELGPEEVGLIQQYTGMTPEDIGNLGPNAQRRVLARAMQAQEADNQRSTLVTSFGEDPLSSPASKPDVPGDRMAMPGELDESGRRITGDAREAGIGANVNPEVARQAAARKAKMVEKLDAMRQQKDALDNSEVRRELKRKADMGLTMTDNERKTHAAWEAQRAKLNKSIFDLEGRIYDTEAKSEQGSKTATGTSDRPFRMDQPEAGSFEEAARGEAEQRARQKAAEEQQAAIDRLEDEWRERQRMRREERAQQDAGQRKEQDQREQQSQQKYAGKKGSTTEAPMEGGKFKVDESGFVMSDTGSPLQFGHQRDAGWWILKRGNKGNTGQVFEIANHPSGKGYTVRVTMDNGGSNGGNGAGDGGSAGGSGVGGGNLAVRGNADRGTGGQRGQQGRTGTPGGSLVQNGAVADAGQQDAPLGRRAKDVDPEIAAEVQRMAANAGLAEQGGRAIRDPVTGDVVDRTKHIPNEAWWLERPSTDRVGKRGKVSRRFKHSEAETKAAVQAWADGKALTAKQQEIVDFMIDVAETDRRMAREDAERMRDLESEAEAAAEREAIQAEQRIVDDPGVAELDIGRQVSVDEFEAWLGANDGQARDQGGAGQADAGEAQGRGGEGGAEAERQGGNRAEAQPFVLDRPGPDDIRAADERHADEQRQREQPVSGADEFVLAGSNRPVDQAEARGQRSLLDEGPAPKKQDAYAPVNSVDGQKNLASRAIRIATLKMMNEQIRKLDPTEAWHNDNIEDARDLDALQDSISQTLVDLQRKQQAAKPEADKPSGGATLYSNPFADPKLWAEMAKDAGLVLKSLNKAMADAFGWSLDHAGSFGKFMRDWGNEISDFVGHDTTGNRKAFGHPAWRLTRAFLDQGGADMMAVAKRSGSKTMTDLVKLFHNEAGDFSGDARVTYSHKTEYEYNKMMSPVARALNDVEELAKTAGRDIDKTLDQVYALVTSPRNIRPGNPIHDAAKTIRKALDDALVYMREAGVQIGDSGRDYFPRRTDRSAVLNNKEGFKRALVQTFMEPRQDGKSPLTEAQAKVAAEELHDTIVYGENSLFAIESGKPQADFMKGRVFGKQVENPKHPLYPFLVHDAREVLPAYFQSVARRAEFARIFGETPEKWEAMRKQMIKDGAHPDAIGKLTNFIQGVAGLRKGDRGDGALAWARTMGYVMFLEKAVFTSLPEFLMPAIRTGNLMNIHRSLIATVRSLADKNSKDIRELTELMDMFGILRGHFGDLVSQNRWGGGDMESGKLTKLMDRHSRMTGLTQWTEATRYGAFAVNRVFMRQLARGVKDKAGKVKTDLLAEVGVPRDKIKPFSDWLLSANNGMPTRADMDKAPKEMKQLYERAMQMLDKSEILRPTATTRPGWINDHPILGLVTQLMSYNYAFLGEAWKRHGRNAYRGVKDTGKAIGKQMGMDVEPEYTMSERFQLAQSLMLMPLLVAAQGMFGELRDLLDPSLREELTPELKFWRAMSRAVPFAPIDPFLNIVSGAKYQRSATETISGPTLGIVGRGTDALVDYFKKNSENTNTTERAMARSFYDLALEPGFAVALTLGYAVAPAQYQPLFMAARQTLGAGAAKEMVVREMAPTLQELSGDTSIDQTGKKQKRGSGGGGDSLAAGGF